MSSPLQSTQAPPHRKPTLLFVDDEPQALKYFEKTVGREFPVLVAGSAADARRLLDEHEPAIGIVVSDQRMPSETGVQLLEYVRAKHPGIVRILTTAYSDLESAIRSVNEGGVFWYITKPWNAQELTSVLIRAARFWELQRERDLLLSNKLSVLQSVLATERATGLVLLAAALQPESPGAFAGLLMYLQAAQPYAAGIDDATQLVGLGVRAMARDECQMLLQLGQRARQTLGALDQAMETVDLHQALATTIARHRTRDDFDAVEVSLTALERPLSLAAPRGLIERLFGELLGKLVNVDGQPLRIVAHAEAAVEEQGVQRCRVLLTAQQPNWSEAAMAPWFSAALASPSGMMGLDMDTLVAFLLAARLGGRLSVVRDAARTGFELNLPVSASAPAAVASEEIMAWLDAYYAQLQRTFAADQDDVDAERQAAG